MPVQHYVKHALANEDASIGEIARRADVCWRTAAKCAHQADWNPSPPTAKARRRPVLDHVRILWKCVCIHRRELPYKACPLAIAHI